MNRQCRIACKWISDIDLFPKFHVSLKITSFKASNKMWKRSAKQQLVPAGGASIEHAPPTHKKERQNISEISLPWCRYFNLDQFTR